MKINYEIKKSKVLLDYKKLKVGMTIRINQAPELWSSSGGDQPPMKISINKKDLTYQKFYPMYGKITKLIDKDDYLSGSFKVGNKIYGLDMQSLEKISDIMINPRL